MESMCEYCKEPFVPKRSDAIYCSASCRQLAYVLRKVSGNKPGGIILHFPSIKKQALKLTDRTIDSISETKQVLTDKIEETIPLTEIKNDYPSILKNDIPVNAETNGSHESSFLVELKKLIAEREYLDILSDYDVAIDLEADWVNQRYRCLVECLLSVSEMSSIELNDLKELCNAFTRITSSKSFKILGSDYPYEQEINSLWKTLRSFCMNANPNQKQEFRFQRQTKLKMLATRWELANFTEKISFSELDFQE